MGALKDSLAALGDRHVVLFGGKGGVGKTTLSIAAALLFAETRPTVLFTTDPASSLGDLVGTGVPASLTIESLDAPALYDRFLEQNLQAFLELGDRGTYLDREELRRLLELSLPGIDELMAWMRIGELAEEREGATIVVDTAPTGHTMRMLAAAGHFRQLASALDAMQEKHRAMVRQFMRRDVHDALDQFIDDFDAAAKRRAALLSDAKRTSFVPVTLSEPLVVEQTIRLANEAGIDVPFVILNRAVLDPDCAKDETIARRDAEARSRFAPRTVVDAPRACEPLDTLERIQAWLDGAAAASAAGSSATTAAEGGRRSIVVAPLVFLAGKGGVGKTTCATSIALNLAKRNPSGRYVVISVDPAHSLRDVFADRTPPPNLAVETIDTRGRWQRFRDSIGREVSDAIDAVTPRGMTLMHDREAMEQLIEMAPPGADEIFAVTRLADLSHDEGIAGVIVDTAPTGHFLRLLALPRQAGEWLREFMRLLLRYRDLIPAGSLGEELVQASRSMRELESRLRSDRTSVIVVTRPERIVVAETRRLVSALAGEGIAVGGIVANYLTPESACACEARMRVHELEQLASFPEAILMERRDPPPQSLEDIESLFSGIKMQP